ncbi:MAG: phosphate ABC transporter substrate-binding protein [Actinobacteria bacterium]|nr:phosphate ABC transporter substrate-binding protein [Actinomycetota bacterium]
MTRLKRLKGIGILTGVLVLLLAIGLLAAGCGESDSKNGTTSEEGKSSGVSGKVTCSGSTTVLPIAEEAASMFMDENPDAEVEVQGGGSSTGISQVKEGVVDIGNASRDLKDEEDDGSIVDHKIALDIICIAVNPGVGVDNLTRDQVKGIFTGAITNWSEVGGADGQITVVIRDAASGTREIFDEKALEISDDNPVELTGSAMETNSNGIMRETVASTPNSIGYISFGYLDDTIKAVNYEGVTPTIETAKDGSYPLSRYLHMFTNGEPEGAVKGFIEFVMSDEFQNDVVGEDYIPITKL